MTPVGLMSCAILYAADGVVERPVVSVIARLAAHVQTFAQCRHARVLGARPDHGAVGNAVVGRGFGARRVAAQLGELCLQRAEALVRRIEAVERRAGIAGVGDLAQDVGRLRRVIAVIDFRQHAGRRDAADREMARVR